MVWGRKASQFEVLRDAWLARWPDALACWSPYTRLSTPRFCASKKEAAREHLTTSFAMIRLADHAVVIDLETIVAHGLQDHAVPVLAHEIGHHVYCPGDLRDHARMLLRIRRGLPTLESLAPFVANLWSDLLINDRLMRVAKVDIAGVYRALGVATVEEPVWWIYLRTYEILWALPRGTLAVRATLEREAEARLEGDAELCARVVRAYAADWIEGAGSFAALLFSHLLIDRGDAARRTWAVLHDTEKIGLGGEVDGLSDMADEGEAPVHPSRDPNVTGEDKEASSRGEGRERQSRGARRGEQKHAPNPVVMSDLLRALGSDMAQDEIVVRYYEEQARPHLVPFPVRRMPGVTDEIPEGLDPWEPGSPLERVDWVQSVLRSPVVIPGATTVERVYGEVPGSEPAVEPVDLYVGIDCSGSMGNPALTHTHAIVAASIVALSALRAGARVKVVLSGEPGKVLSTPGFERDRRTVMRTLTSYLGTGYAFNIHRLGETFTGQRNPTARPAHILVVTDSDVFRPLAETDPTGRDGWAVARDALAQAGGGGTYVLRLPSQAGHQEVARMQADGWDVHRVVGEDDLVTFARAFARKQYAREVRVRSARRVKESA